MERNHTGYMIPLSSPSLMKYYDLIATRKTDKTFMEYMLQQRMQLC